MDLPNQLAQTQRPAMPSSHVVIARIYGGLGNQLFMYACGLALAARNEVPLLLDVGQLGDEQQRPYGLGVFRLRATHADLATIRAVRGFSDGKLSSEWFRIRKSLGLAANPSYIREHGFRFDPRVVAHPVPAYLKGHWMCERYFADQATAVRRDLAFVDEPHGLNAELARAIGARMSASVHVRRGDYLNGGNQQVYAQPGSGYYQRAVQALRERVPDVQLYCFSDDPAWAKSALGLPPETVFVTHNGAAGHEDLRLMSLCRHHIIANSTFSWWGAWLNPNPAKIVIAPATWYLAGSGHDATDLVPESWLRIAID